jgi:hypothetical protein
MAPALWAVLEAALHLKVNERPASVTAFVDALAAAASAGQASHSKAQNYAAALPASAKIASPQPLAAPAPMAKSQPNGGSVWTWLVSLVIHTAFAALALNLFDVPAAMATIVANIVLTGAIAIKIKNESTDPAWKITPLINIFIYLNKINHRSDGSAKI